MEFKLHFPIANPGLDLCHGDQVVLLGSCFSDSMVNHFENSGFRVLSNPFGTVFHPVAICDEILNACKNETTVSIVQRDDIYFSWGFSRKIFGSSEMELRSAVLKQRELLRNTLQQSKYLMLTFGTSWGYSHVTHGLVANCHKLSSGLFSKELWSTESMYKVCERMINTVKELNSEIEIIFSVSPVRHKKDGLVENNRSKSRLIELVHLIVEKNAGSVHYFPAYEIVIDELRDYRFFTSDLVHPTTDAVVYVWEKFQQFACSENTIRLSKEIQNVNTMFNHQSLFPNSHMDENRKVKVEELRDSLDKRQPGIYWK